MGSGRVATTRLEALQARELAAIILDLHSNSLFPKKFCIYPLLGSYKQFSEFSRHTISGDGDGLELTYCPMFLLAGLSLVACTSSLRGSNLGT